MPTEESRGASLSASGGISSSAAAGAARSNTRSTPSAGAPSAPRRAATQSSGQPLSNPNTSDDGISAATLRALKSPAYYTKEVAADVANHEGTLHFVEYALAATSTQLQDHSEWEKVTTIPNICKETMGLPGA